MNIILSSLLSFTAIVSGTQPNIVLIMMDDLGFADTNYNGGDVPTPTLNKFANGGIKLNYHYSNTICSASRSSLLTGRYAWRTGAASLIYQNTEQHTDEHLTFISTVLQENGYKTAMFGKYHLGYASQSYLPYNRGFDHTFFFKAGATSYHSHLNCPSWSLLFNNMDLEIDDTLQDKLREMEPNGFCSHDLWTQDAPESVLAIEGNGVDGIYNEQLFTDGIKEFIVDNANATDPFFIYYAMPTPHWPLEAPPKTFDECESMPGSRKDFCNVLMFGDELIGQIVDSLKENDKYDDTILIFLSDNGPNPNWQSDEIGVDLPNGSGQTLPLRGAKGSTFEGGIRTPAAIYGGYVDANCGNAQGSYEGMVHISDWFAIIKNVAGVSLGNYIETDIDGLDLWRAICESDGVYETKRDTIHHLELVDATDHSQGLKASYIRKNEWKLVINASLSFLEIPSNEYWPNYDSKYSTQPPVKKYKQMMKKQKLSSLYASECYDAFLQYGDESSDDSVFAYSEYMLFNVDKDKVEACNLASKYPSKVEELKEELLSMMNFKEYAKWNKIAQDESGQSKQGTMAQADSYDCDTRKAYHVSWKEMDGYENEADLTWSFKQIFYKYLYNIDHCTRYGKRAKKTTFSAMFGGILFEQHPFVVTAGIAMVAIASLMAYLFVIVFNGFGNRMEAKLNSRIGDEYTALLPA